MMRVMSKNSIHVLPSQIRANQMCFGLYLSMANYIITRPLVFGTALDSAASIHRTRTLQVNAGRHHLFQAGVHSTLSACGGYGLNFRYV